MAANNSKLRVGILGAGLVAQVVHLPTLFNLMDLYTVVGVCDISQKTAEAVARKYSILCYKDASILINSPDIDVVFNLTSDEYHVPYTVKALQAGKHVMLEKPITLSIPAAKQIIEAEKAANGPRVFVGFMRRYAPSFIETFKREISTIPKILYARSRDIIGPNSHFVGQAGIARFQFNDVPLEATEERKRLFESLMGEAWGCESGRVTPEQRDFALFICTLGSHDLSLMREILGPAESVSGVSANEPFYSAILNFRNKTGEPFSLTYESGIDNVPRFDAHFAVYGERKSVEIRYQTPFVKGLPIVVKVDELSENGEAVTREILASFEDAYTVELKELYECLVNRKEIKTSAEDALEDLKLFDKMYTMYNEQMQKA